MRKLVVTAVALSFGVLTVGCGVKKSVHQKVLDELAACQGDLGTCTTARESAEGRAGDLERELSETKQTLETEKTAREKAETDLATLNKDLKATTAELAELRKQREAAEKRLAAYRQLNERLRKLVDTGKLKVAFRNGQMVLELPAEILFPSGKAKLRKEGEEALGEVIEILLEFKDRRFMIAGHTDNQKIRTAQFKNNWALSTARAVSVLEYFIERGFAPENLSAAGFGEFAPVSSNDTKEGRALNRRIEIILVPDLSELPNLTDEPAG